MHTFRVVKEQHGWAVRLGEGMSTPFWTRALAVQEANCLCDGLRRHGQRAEVVVEEPDGAGGADAGARLSADRLAQVLGSILPRRR